MNRIAFALMAAATFVACGRSSSDAASDSAVAASSLAAASSTAPKYSTEPPCPPTGRWAPCSVEKRLKRSGLVARKIDSAVTPRAGFSVNPQVYKLGRDSRLEIFIYASEAALAKDIAKMDTVRVAPIGGASAWTSPHVLIRSGNLAAVLLTTDAREADRLFLALTAGAPQPGR
jgi:hypothetical protein